MSDSVEREGFIMPSWPAPAGIRAASTTRQHGGSRGPFGEFNLGAHVGDRPEDVARNRSRLRDCLDLPSEPVWLRQVHGCRVVDASTYVSEDPADAAIARESSLVCAVLTADCLPVLFCDRRGGEVAAAHAGWRGLAAGVLEETVSCMHAAADELIAWIGPAIGPSSSKWVQKFAMNSFPSMVGRQSCSGLRPRVVGWPISLVWLASVCSVWTFARCLAGRGAPIRSRNDFSHTGVKRERVGWPRSFGSSDRFRFRQHLVTGS